MAELHTIQGVNITALQERATARVEDMRRRFFEMGEDVTPEMMGFAVVCVIDALNAERR